MCTSASVNSDNLVELEEQFSITLSLVTLGASLSIGNNATIVTLTDSDGMMWLSQCTSGSKMLLY
jgi:hypothetical protein